MTDYYQAWFSAETEEQADNILKALLDKKLIVGGTILNGPSRFWWKGEKIEMDYYYVMAFTTSDNKEEIEDVFSKVSEEEIPMVAFIEMDGNDAFLDFISEYAE